MKKAILLVNLGSPDSTKVKDVRKYLREFLMDERVIDFPYIPRWLLVNGIICNFRAPKSAKAYETVWREEGSPLIILTQELAEAVEQASGLPVTIAMRYGNPNPKFAMDQLVKQHPDLEELIVLPLYPHQTMSSYDTAVAYIQKIYEEQLYPFSIKYIDPFFNHPDYIKALASSIKPYLKKDFDKLVFSYHGIPERQLKKDEAFRKSNNSNPLKELFNCPEENYQQQCLITSRLVAEELNIPFEKTESTFQSRLVTAGNEWIKPYTAMRFSEMPKEDVKNVYVVCPAFINDCLETLEEIAMEAKEIFLEAGGERYEYIPCVNNHPEWVNTIVDWTN